MAFKRTNFKSLVSNNRERFSTAYKFSKKANFEVGKDAYIIPLGLESGFYETPVHRILPHKVNGKLVGFNGTTFTTYIKCKGIDSEGNRSDSLCCTLAQLEKERIPDKNDSGKRIVSFTNYRVHLPVLILSNSLTDKTKASYPINVVSILNDLRSENGLNFAYIEMASSSFKNDILGAYGKKLKEEGLMDYELDENSEEFLQEVCEKLSNTVIKVHGIAKQGFDAALKEYSFFPFSNPSIANASPEGEREAIIGYKDNQEIQNKICEFLDLFNVEVDNMFNDWTEKDLQEYYNSAIGVDLTTPITPAQPKAAEEVVEVVDEVEVVEAPIKKVTPKPAKKEEPVYTDSEGNVQEPPSDDDIKALLEDPFANKPISSKVETDSSLDEFEFDSEDDDAFFED